MFNEYFISTAAMGTDSASVGVDRIDGSAAGASRFDAHGCITLPKSVLPWNSFCFKRRYERTQEVQFCHNSIIPADRTRCNQR